MKIRDLLSFHGQSNFPPELQIQETHLIDRYDLLMEAENQNHGNHTNSSQSDMSMCLADPRQKALITFSFVVSLVLGQPMSARLLWITLRSKHRDVLNCNLALFNLLRYCFFYAQVFCIYITPPMQAPFYKFIFVYIQVVGPMTLCLVCLERFIAVIYPTYFPLLRKYSCREACAAVVWVSSITLAALTLFSKRLHSVKDVVKFVPVYLMATLSLITCLTSVKVARVLRNPAVGRESIHPMKKRAFLTICVTSAAAMSCYIPVMVMGQLYVIDEAEYKCVLVPLCIFLLSAASLMHPMFYLYAKGEFNRRRCPKKIRSCLW